MTAALTDPPDVAVPAPATAPRRVVTIRPAPRREPPFDDEVRAAWRGPTPHRFGERHAAVVVGPWDQPLPFDEPDPPPAPALVVPGAVAAGDPGADDLPDPEVWTRRLLGAMFEVAAGRRPGRQLATLTSPTVGQALTVIALRRGRLGRIPLAGEVPVVRSVHVCRPATGVAEVAVTVRSRGRVHALALRLEGEHDRWRCVRVQAG